MGERVYINRDKIDLPEHHKLALFKILNMISSLGMLLSTWAIVYYSVWGAIVRVTLAYLEKSWYLNRTVWLYEDMREVNEEYKSWYF